jgi:hypothetical protein
MRLEKQRKRIMAGVKSGKLTKDEAKALHEKVKSIREELWADVKQNEKKELTEEQYQQLNQELNANSTAIKDDKSEEDGNAPAGSSAPTQ